MGCSIQEKNSPYSTSRETIDSIQPKDRDSNLASHTEQASQMSAVSEASRLFSLSTGGFDYDQALYQKRIVEVALSNPRIALGSHLTEAEIRAQESPFAGIKGYSAYLNAHYA